MSESDAPEDDSTRVSIFHTVFDINNIEVEPIANFQVDEHTSVSVNRIQDKYCVSTTLDESFENMDRFDDEAEAHKYGQQMAAEMMTWHIPEKSD